MRCRDGALPSPGYNQWARMKKKDDLKHLVSQAILACQDKQAEDVTILELEKDSGAFTDYFVMCSGANPRQVQAISDAVDERLEALGLLKPKARKPLTAKATSGKSLKSTAAAPKKTRKKRA